MSIWLEKLFKNVTQRYLKEQRTTSLILSQTYNEHYFEKPITIYLEYRNKDGRD